MRLSKNEYDKLIANAEAAKMTRTEYIRQVAIYDNPKTVGIVSKVYRTLNETVVELRKQGVNLNQIARLYNTYGIENADNILKGELSNTISTTIEVIKSTRDVIALAKEKLGIK